MLFRSNSLRWIAEGKPDASGQSSGQAETGRRQSARCLNCEVTGEFRVVLYAPVGEAGETALLACDSCGARFFVGPQAGDYGEMPLGGHAALAFYLQQGANIGGMAMRLGALGRPAGSSYLEVGCGFGLSLDFARRTLGWQVRGLDPSPFAAAGREQLDLPIERRFLQPDGLDAASADIVHASEFIEHVSDPVAMLDTLRRALRPGGTLLLTTPAAEMIAPETGDGLLLPLLSVGWHVVLQTADSLRWALGQAGFGMVEVVREGAQLIAIAGQLPPALQCTRADYLRWLRDIAAAAPQGSDLGLGSQARLYRETVIADDPGADNALAGFVAAMASRYGLSLTEAAQLPMAPLPLVELAAREPLCLHGVFMARGWQARRLGEAADGWFAAAISAATRLRQSLNAIGSDDGDAEDILLAAEAERILILAEHGAAGVMERLEALSAAGGASHADRMRGPCMYAAANAELGLGKAARCYRDLVTAQAEEADAALERFAAIMMQRFGLTLEDAAAFPAARLSLTALARREPVSLHGVFMARGWQARRRCEEADGWFAAAIAAASRVTHALGELGLDDADARSILHAAEAERIIIMAERGGGDVAARIIALRQAGGVADAARIEEVCFVTLVNRGALPEALAMSDVAQPLLRRLGRADVTALSAADAALVYCAAALQLQLPQGRHDDAVVWLQQLRTAIGAQHRADGDVDPAVRALVRPAADAEMLGWRMLGQNNREAMVDSEANALVAAMDAAGGPPSR